MKNVVLIHGSEGVITFEDSLRSDCGRAELAVFMPNFFAAKKHLNYDYWKSVLTELKDKNILNEKSIVVAHSVGTIAFLKFVAETGFKVDTYISVSGFTGQLRKTPKNIAKMAAMKIVGFSLAEKEMQAASKLIKNKHSIYSNNDHLIEQKELERYANLLGAEKHFAEGLGHFSRTLNIKEIPVLSCLIKNAASKNANENTVSLKR